MKKNQHILILDDEPDFRTEIKEHLEREGYNVYSEGLPSKAMDIIKSRAVDVALFDIRLPEMDGLALLKKVKALNSVIEVIMMTGYGTMNSAVDALRYGAVDFLKKPFKLSELSESIQRVIPDNSLPGTEDETNLLFDRLLKDRVKLIGNSKPMVSVKNIIQKVSRAEDTTVLITGESGTGKELVSRSIHLLSDRKNKPFIPVNCSSIPEELFENEFFGHVQGSYTDARKDQKGLFESANGGTLFLDEIGDMKLSSQAKLLRVIEEKKISRIGENTPKDVDVRILAATNQDLEEKVKQKQFREDLYHRINLIRITVPPLRDRAEDIPMLFEYFLNEYSGKHGKPICKMEPGMMDKLLSYPFPGNVRELKHLVERAVILCEGGLLKSKFFLLPAHRIQKDGHRSQESKTPVTIDSMERDLIITALKEAGNNKSKTARILNISRQALDRRIKKYNISLSA